MRTLVVIYMIFSVLGTYAQDKIVYYDGSIKNAKVTEIGLKEIRYKKPTNLQGPDYVILKSDVLRIEYENGSIDYFGEDPNESRTTPNHYSIANTKKDEPNLRKRMPHGLTIMVLGPTVIGSASYEYFASPTWDIEVGLGLIGLYAGANYHFGGKNELKKTTPYIGLKGTLGMQVADFFGWWGPRFGPGVYVPVGLNILYDNGFYICPEGGAHFTYASGNLFGASDLYAVRPWFGLKLGYRFD